MFGLVGNTSYVWFGWSSSKYLVRLEVHHIFCFVVGSLYVRFGWRSSLCLVWLEVLNIFGLVGGTQYVCLVGGMISGKKQFLIFILEAV